MKQKGKEAAYIALLDLQFEDLVDAKKVRSKLRKKDYVRERRWCAEVLRAKGFSLSEIGYALNRHHSTVLSLLKKRENEKPTKTKRKTSPNLVPAQAAGDDFNIVREGQ